MRLSRFIELNLEEILAAWESFARSMAPTTDGMDIKALRDHAKQILEAVANDIETSQTTLEQSQKSKGLARQGEGDESAASLHGSERHGNKFSMSQLASEYRALRATVLRLWMPQITDVREVTEDMVRFNEAIDQALAESIVSFGDRTEGAKQLFLAMLSHDLRAPLASMSSAGHVLSHSTLSLRQAAEMGPLITRGANLMSRMVDDLADYTRSQLGEGLKLSRQYVDLSDACSSAVHDAMSMNPGACFDIFLDGDLKGLFDGIRIHRLLTNLLVNAAQHGDQVAPVVLQARSDGDSIVVVVINQGPPIPREAFTTIFEPMVQLTPGEDDAQTRPNMGLGLYIARVVAEAHGGGISVASEEGKATVFTVSLPRDFQ